MMDVGLKALPKLYFTAGVHPHDAKTCDNQTFTELAEMATHSSCVAIGECGLDYDRMFTPRDKQLEGFRKQVELAVKLNYPLFLHERDRDASKGAPLGSQQDLLKILEECRVDASRVCIHCYTGTQQSLADYVSRGYFIGLTGFAGMKTRGAKLRAALQAGALPLEKLMLETDCPFMMPDRDYIPEDVGVSGKKNEPCVMPGVCNAVAECYGVDPKKVAEQTTATAQLFFGLQARP
jgi:TatD DNase family protein